MIRRLELALPPVALLLIVAALMAAATRALPAWTAGAAPGLRAAAAMALAALGAAIALAGVFAFRSARTSVDPRTPERTRALVTAGVYRRTRNPMYVGFALALSGWALWLAHPLAALGVPLFVAWIDRLQIAPEERALRARFGAAFDAYCAQSRRWL